MTPITQRLIKKPAIYGMILLFAWLPLVVHNYEILISVALPYCGSRGGNERGVLEDVADDADLVAIDLDHRGVADMLGEYAIPVLDHIARHHLSRRMADLSRTVG